jgi:hypothetical protein
VRESTLRDIAAWSAAIGLDFDADPAVWERLAADSVRGDVAPAALSESLSNVVRHASRPVAQVRLCAPRDAPADVQQVESGHRHPALDPERPALASRSRASRSQSVVATPEHPQSSPHSF